MARAKEPSIGILLGVPSKGRRRDEEPMQDEDEAGLDPAVDAQLTKAFPDLDDAGKEALVEAFRLCFEEWEREPHEEAEHEAEGPEEAEDRY